MSHWRGCALPRPTRSPTIWARAATFRLGNSRSRVSFCFRRASRPAAVPISSKLPTSCRDRMSALKIDVDRRSVSLDPRDPSFFHDPYPAYHAIRTATPAFFWEQYGFWCFAGHSDVSALLRDWRFGRQILHVMNRRQLGWDEPPPHLQPFLDLEKHSLLELEPPEHTR